MPRRSEPLSRHREMSPKIGPSKTRVIHDGVRMDVHGQDSSGTTEEISKRSRLSTPVSKAGNRIGLSQKEGLHRIAFLESMVQTAVTWDDIPPLYKEEFGIWRSAASLRNAYNQRRGRSKKSAETYAPSQSAPQTPTERADNDEGRRSQRDRSPTPMSTRLKRIPASEQEIRYRYPFINSQLEKGATWDEIPALYREEFGIWRTVLALRREYSLDGKRRDDIRSSSVMDFAPNRRANNVAGNGSKRHSSPTPVSERKHTIITAEQEKLHRNHFSLSQRLKKRKRSPSPAPATYNEVLPTEQEVLHRSSFLESHRQAGLSWNKIAELYCEDFGISRPCRALMNWYHSHRRSKHKGEIDSSVQESASALLPGSDSEDDQPLIRRCTPIRLANYKRSKSGCEKGTGSNASSPRLVSVSRGSTSEASSPSLYTPPPSTLPQTNDPASLVASHAGQIQPSLVARTTNEPVYRESTPMTARADEPETSSTVSEQSQPGTNSTGQRTLSAATSTHMTLSGSSQNIANPTNRQSQSTAAPIPRIMPEPQPSLATHIGQFKPNPAALDADDVKPPGGVSAFNGLPCIDETTSSRGSCDDPIDLD